MTFTITETYDEETYTWGNDCRIGIRVLHKGNRQLSDTLLRNLRKDGAGEPDKGCSVLGNNTYTNCETGAAAKFDNSWQCQTGIKKGFLGIETAEYKTYTSEFVGQCYSVQINFIIEINDIKGTVIIDGEKVYYDYTKI